MDELAKLHELDMMLADEVKRICEKHDIQYSMLGGTMLGAVRHKGFIPWDDDMDFAMLRGEYERFIKACEEDLDTEKFYLLADYKDTNHCSTTARLILKAVKIKENAFYESVDFPKGLFIDIMPMDTVPDGTIKRKMYYTSMWIVKNLLWVKLGYGKNRAQSLAYRVARLFSHFVTLNFLRNFRYKRTVGRMNRSSQCVTSVDGFYGIKHETIKRKWFDSIVEYPFEDRSYAGFADYDGYLTELYGDYMRIPPEEERHYHNQGVDFGIYGEE